MDNIVREVLKTKIVGLKGTAFQDAMDRICLCIYGESGYQRVKQKKDGGSDGIVNNHIVLAAYAPEKYALRDFKTKVSGDYKSYSNNWAATHSGWNVVTNLEATAQMIQYVQSLKKDAVIVCIEALLQLIASQTWTVKLSIFRALDISERYITNDVVSTVIEDLIQHSQSGGTFKPYEKPEYIEDKIALNVAEENRDAFLEEYEESLSLFPTIAHVIKTRDQNSVSALRTKIRSTFVALSGNFESKLASMVNMLSYDKSNDDYYTHNMRVVLIYFFEQCLYGIKSKSEINND